MKLLVSFLVFAISLTLSTTVLANEGKDLSAEMNALFPKPLPNMALSTPPAKPELESPPYFQKLSDLKVTLKWKAAEDASVYHVQVATDPNFKWLVKEEQLFSGNTLEVAGLDAGKHYFWRVAGVKPGNKNGHIKGAYASSMFETSTK
jgi:hypothetical protein